MLLITGVMAFPVGVWIDKHGSRLLMTAGSVGASALVIAWSQVNNLTTFYLIWTGLGEYSQIVVAVPGRYPDPEAHYADIATQKADSLPLTVQDQPVYKLPPPPPSQITPVVAPRPGHTALVLAAGVADGAVIDTEAYAGIGDFISSRSLPVCREELEVFLGGALCSCHAHQRKIS